MQATAQLLWRYQFGTVVSEQSSNSPVSPKRLQVQSAELRHLHLVGRSRSLYKHDHPSVRYTTHAFKTSTILSFPLSHHAALPNHFPSFARRRWDQLRHDYRFPLMRCKLLEVYLTSLRPRLLIVPSKTV